jgi:hypothetical protein
MTTTSLVFPVGIIPSKLKPATILFKFIGGYSAKYSDPKRPDSSNVTN